jgi:uncharacterized membrane protein
MNSLEKIIANRLNKIIIGLIVNGLFLITLGIFIVKFQTLFRLVAALVTIVLAYTFLYAGITIYFLKKEIKDHFRI